ncbi:MAG: hypothetical protein Q9M89_10520 [Persephonella sp.]|nr:hypothetical protein [Persephonella sp.]
MPGSYTPRSLQANQLKPPWDTNPGNQTMYCSDCHGTDNEAGIDPKGPHGSMYKFMLKGPNKYWPADANGRLYKVGDIFGTTGFTTNGLFCVNCHNLENAEVHQYKGNKNKFKDYACVYCHVAVPHGSPVSRLIGYENFPQPYNYNGNSLKLNGFKKIIGLKKWQASSINPLCHPAHKAEAGVNYDPNPYP